MKLKEIADKVKILMVDGEEVHLRLPPEIEKNRLVAVGLKVLNTDDESKERDNSEVLVSWSEITGKALKLCVADHDDMTEDDWQRLITASREPDNDIEGLPELVSECMKLCGFTSEVNTEDSTDEIDEVIASVGESPS